MFGSRNWNKNIPPLHWIMRVGLSGQLGYLKCKKNARKKTALTPNIQIKVFKKTNLLTSHQFTRSHWVPLTNLIFRLKSVYNHSHTQIYTHSLSLEWTLFFFCSAIIIFNGARIIKCVSLFQCCWREKRAFSFI